MSETKRRWFQFHLLTLVLMILIAALCLGMNFRANRKAVYEAVDEIEYGWPFPVRLWGVRKVEGEAATKVNVPTMEIASSIALNVLVCMTLSTTAGFICEYLIRRREGRTA